MSPLLITIYGLGAYLLGSLPFAYLLGRLRGVDIRTVGSGNVGATNLVRACGLGWGALALLGDCGKGFVPAFLATRLDPDRVWIATVAGALAVVGHCYTPFLGFKGGKGVATTAGVLLAVAPLGIGVLLAIWGLTLLLFRNVGVASSLAALGGLGLGVRRLLAEPPENALGVFLVILSGLVIYRHRRNIAEYLKPSQIPKPQLPEVES